MACVNSCSQHLWESNAIAIIWWRVMPKHQLIRGHGLVTLHIFFMFLAHIQLVSLMCQAWQELYFTSCNLIIRKWPWFLMGFLCRLILWAVQLYNLPSNQTQWDITCDRYTLCIWSNLALHSCQLTDRAFIHVSGLSILTQLQTKSFFADAFPT